MRPLRESTNRNKEDLWMFTTTTERMTGCIFSLNQPGLNQRKISIYKIFEEPGYIIVVKRTGMDYQICISQFWQNLNHVILVNTDPWCLCPACIATDAVFYVFIREHYLFDHRTFFLQSNNNSFCYLVGGRIFSSWASMNYNYFHISYSPLD